MVYIFDEDGRNIGTTASFSYVTKGGKMNVQNIKNWVVRKLTEALSDEEVVQTRVWTLQVRLEKGLWVFDYPTLGVFSEPFIAGIPEIIEHHLSRKNILEKARKHGFAVSFTAKGDLPEADSVLELVGESLQGGTYRDRESGLEGWLCPCLRTFLKTPPQEIKIQILG